MPVCDRSELLSCFQAHKQDIDRFLRRRLNSRDVAADVSQEIWLKLADIQPTASIDNPRAYVFRLAANLAVDTARAMARRDRRVLAAAAASARPDPAPSAERIVLGQELLERLRGVLGELPVNARTALLLSRLDCLPHRQIAARLKVSESMVAKYIAQAQRHCRERIAAEERKISLPHCKAAARESSYR